MLKKASVEKGDLSHVAFYTEIQLL